MAQEDPKQTGQETSQQFNLASELDQKIADIQKENVEEHAKTAAQKIGLPYVDLKIAPINETSFLLVSEEDSRKAKLIVMTKEVSELRVAVLDPQLPETQELLNRLTEAGYTYILYIASSTGMSYAWERYLRHREEIQKPKDVIEVETTSEENIKKKVTAIDDIKDKILSLPVTKVVDALISGALQLGASDIHIEPETKTVRLRYRLDGVLIDILRFELEKFKDIVSRIKLTSGMKINVSDVPQDGRFEIHQEEKDTEVRVSVLPGPLGESIVMRILDPGSIRQKLEDLGMRDDLMELIKHQLKKTTGAILTTGPTGSGKTTTLYAFIQTINNPSIKVITLEDPVEYRIEGITQTQVDKRAGYTFTDGLRSIVRQDPDVILVGEMRDQETAEMTMQAALTGHLVFSTIHANSATGTVPRLIDLGVKAVTIAPAVNIAMSQRLVRKLCLDCRVKEKIKRDDFDFMKTQLEILPKNIPTILLEESSEIYYAKKCQACNFTGYKGRTGVYEIFEIDNDIERLIITLPAATEIEKLAIEKGMVTLLQDGLLKVLNGTTSFDEVMRVIGE